MFFSCEQPMFLELLENFDANTFSSYEFLMEES